MAWFQTGQFRSVDMHKLAELMLSGKRWKDLPNAAAFPVNKAVLVTTTDVRKSNSAAMYLALMSYVTNGDQVVDDRATAEARGREARTALPAPGLPGRPQRQPRSPTMSRSGMGKTPLLFAYESQCDRVSAQAGCPAPARHGGAPALAHHPVEERLRPLHRRRPPAGHPADERPRRSARPRTATATACPTMPGFRPAWTKAGIAAPGTILEVADPPSFETLETMIGVIEAKLQ